MSFFECEFPTEIGFAAVGGPGFNTTINTGFSGFEQRNKNWANSLGQWKIELTYKDQSYFDKVQAFFLNVGGQADAFRFKDHKDFSVTGQSIGTGDGSSTAFQLIKTYVAGGRTYTRTIKKPIQATVQKFDGTFCANTVNIYDNGVLQTLGTNYTVDATTGIVTFTTAPAAGHAITADFEFHLPVRFNVDEMQAQIEPSDVPGGNSLITWANVALMEVRI